MGPRRTRGVGGLPPGLGHGVQGGVGGTCPQFKPWRTRGVQGAEPPVLQVHGVQGGSGGLAPRFRPWRTRGGPGGLPPV